MRCRLCLGSTPTTPLLKWCVLKNVMPPYKFLFLAHTSLLLRSVGELWVQGCDGASDARTGEPHTYTHADTHTHAHTHTPTQTLTRTYTHADTHGTHTHTQTQTQTRQDKQTNRQTDRQMRTHTRTCRRTTRTHNHARMWTQTHKHARTHGHVAVLTGVCINAHSA